MGWLGRLFDKLSGEKPREMIFVPAVPATDAPWVGEKFETDQCYVELYVESLRLDRSRRFATRFNGVVYSFSTLPRDGDNKAQFAAVSKPDKLTELDRSSLDKVITVSKQMMAPVAWRGGPLSLEIGLFSVKAGNLLSPILDYVTKVSSAAGVSFVGSVKPFLPLITEGMDLIAGQKDDTELEVALDTDLRLVASGYSAIIDAPKGAVDLAQLTIDRNDGKLLLAGQPLQRGYCVFSLRRTLQKPDYGEIPELKERYAAFQAAIRAGEEDRAKDALTAFRLTTITSPDLISADARALVNKAQQKLTEAFPEGGTRAVAGKREVLQDDLEPLSAIGLYR
jgi:hypothetical protein